jgi:hypothetical protein
LFAFSALLFGLCAAMRRISTSLWSGGITHLVVRGSSEDCLLTKGDVEMDRKTRLMVAAALPMALSMQALADGRLVSQAGPASDAPFNPTGRAVNYLHDDGTSENGVGISGTNPFDIIWLNRFSVVPGGEVITDIQAAIGSPADTRDYNGLAMTVLVYEDADGGSPANATLISSSNFITANANTGILNNYDIPDVTISTSEFFVAVLMRNLPGGAGFVASIDQTLPHVSGVSWAGFAVGAPLDENNLGLLGANLGTIEGFGLPGNWLLRATGAPIPAPATLGLALLGGLVASRRRRA